MFSLSQKMKKVIVLMVIFSLILSGVFFPNTKKVEATVPMFDYIANIVRTAAFYVQTAAKYIVSKTIGGTSPLLTGKAWVGRMLMKRILRQLTMSIVAWIDNGFEGNPSFVTNPGKFLTNAADIAIGDMLLSDPALSFLCEPFQLQVKLSLGLQYRPFREEIKCTFSSVVGNMTNFANGDFIGGGGWDSWLQMTTVPQNNQMGAQILAQGELNARIAKGTKEAELESNWGGGFLSYKKCTNIQTGETSRSMNSPVKYTATVNGQTAATNNEAPVEQQYGPSNTECTIQTPGKEIETALGWAQSSQMRELEIANDLDAIFNALANMAIKKGMAYFSSGSTNNNANRQGEANINYLNSLQAQQDDQQKNANKNEYYTSNGTVNFNRDFTSQVDAINAVNSQIIIETTFFNAQVAIYQLLNDMQVSFASSTSNTCTEFTKNDVISQITGNFVGQKVLVWNKLDIADASAVAANNISVLNTAKDNLSTNTSRAVITQTMQSLVDQHPWHSTIDVTNYSSGGIFIKQITDWIMSKIESASGSTCNVDYYNWSFI
jgi:hypothetical protein